MISGRYGLERFVSEQPPYNILDRNAENELVPACMRRGVAITPFFPIASGLLSGKYRLNAENPEGGRMSRRKPDEDAIFGGAKVLREGADVTLVAAGYSVQLAEEASENLANEGIEAELIDLRCINPLDRQSVLESVRRTRRLVVVDGGWTTCGLAGEILATVAESLPPSALRSAPRRVTLQDAPAPTSGPLENVYYPDASRIEQTVRVVCSPSGR